MARRLIDALSSRIGVAIVLIGLSGAAERVAAAPVAAPDAARLVTVIRMDFTLLDAVQWRVRVHAASNDHAAYECLLKQDYARLNPSLAGRVAERLSDDEVAAALAFYSSSAGRDFTDAALVQVHRQTDANVTEELPDLVHDEVDQIEAFTRTALYPKLQQLLVPLPNDTRAVLAAMQSECTVAAVKSPS